MRGTDTLRTLSVLQQRPEIADVSLYGDAIHALVQEGDAATLAGALAAADISATAEPIAPTLEDGFISLMKR